MSRPFTAAQIEIANKIVELHKYIDDNEHLMDKREYDAHQKLLGWLYSLQNIV